MTTGKKDIDYSILTLGLKKLATETIGTALDKEIQVFQNFTNSFVQSIDEYNTKTAEAINNGSLQVLLYENERLSKTVFSLLEDTIKEKTPVLLKEMTNKFIIDAYKQLELIPENERLSEQIRIARSKKEKSGFLSILSDSKSKTYMNLKAQNEGSSLAAYKQFQNRNFFFYYLILSNLKRQIKLYNTFSSKIILLLNSLWNFDKKRIEQFNLFASTNFQIDVDIKALKIEYKIDEIEQLLNEINSSKDQITEEINIESSNFIDDFNSGKIIEHDTYQSKLNIETESEKLVQAIVKNRQNWQNSIFILAEDWKLDLEVNSFKFYILKQFFNFSKVMDTRYTEPVVDIIELINASLDDLKVNVVNTSKNVKTKFKEQLTESKSEFKRKLFLKIIPVLKEVIIKSEITKAIDSIETDITSRFNGISEKRFVTNMSEYSKPIEKSEFQGISPKDIIGYEFMPQLKAVFPKLKTSFINHVEVFEKKVAEIPEIINFAIESSISFNENEGSVEEAIKISTEGIVRAEKKLAEISGFHQSFSQGEVSTLKLSIEKFLNEITAIADSDSASQINIRIVKLQALAKSKEIRQNISRRIKNFIPVVVENLKFGIRFLWQSSEKIGKQFRIEEKQQFITSETSDYLATTELAINKLPYIYQRLFKIEALKSFELFIGREKPAEILSIAYSKWKEGRFAPIVIIGEKGSGKTTILNWFLKTKVHDEKVILLDLHEVNKTPEMFYNEIEALVADKHNVKASNSESKNTILAIDGLARLFTTEVNGFKYLMKTMKLISDTSSQVLWIVSAHLYSWYYIDKSFNISDYFAYHIKLTDITAADMKGIIERRHNMSGYKLVYEALPEKKSFIRKKKLTYEKMQSELEEIYFKGLAEFNNNNLSQAFLYWLRSTSRVENDVIYIRQIYEIKNNFIKSISLSKMITLKNILINNGITIEGHSRKFNQDFELSKLHLDQMKDDGLLVMAEEYYLINPLIYSQIIRELYILNLLH